LYAQKDNFYELPLDSINKLVDKGNLAYALGKKYALASRTEERLQDAPATMMVITAQEIRERGYTSIADVMADLPGFDNNLFNGAVYMNSYQRGYRTSYTQRTLLMIDGQLFDNHLWSHIIMTSRQYPMGNIERIEVLYGPSSAVYGPNAYLGIINIVTSNGKTVSAPDNNNTTISLQKGSFNSYGLDVGTKGQMGQIAYSVSARIFQSDEEDLSDRWGYLSNSWFGNRDVWGSLLDVESLGKKLGSYYDKSDNYGVNAKLSYKSFQMGVLHWRTSEGYGTQYAADHGQNNIPWDHVSSQAYLIMNKEVNDKFKNELILTYRTNRIVGEWAEAEPDWNAGMEQYSYISYTSWNSYCNSWQLRNNFEYQLKRVLLTGGVKFERKLLSKNYDIPGYWGAYSSAGGSGSDGPHGYGWAIAHSTDSLAYVFPPLPAGRMPSNNLAATSDVGGYLMGIIDWHAFRFNLGIRYDENSIYGSVINPRLAAIYKFSNSGAIKLLYGEAFQEPAPRFLWGGWTGRKANPKLMPEKARNLELNVMYAQKNVFQDISAYYARYENVIQEEGSNAGYRNIFGVEYKVKFSFDNFIPNSSNITAYAYYTYTRPLTSSLYSHTDEAWQDKENMLGDIAPHKVNIGVNLPVSKWVNINIRGNFVSPIELYSRNALVAKYGNYTLPSYFTLNSNVNFMYDKFTLGIKVLNVLDEKYMAPGIESANSGDDFSQRALGFNNSLVPQPGRFVQISLFLDL